MPTATRQRRTKELSLTARRRLLREALPHAEKLLGLPSESDATEDDEYRVGTALVFSPAEWTRDLIRSGGYNQRAASDPEMLGVGASQPGAARPLGQLVMVNVAHRTFRGPSCREKMLLELLDQVLYLRHVIDRPTRSDEWIEKEAQRLYPELDRLLAVPAG